MGAEYTLPSLGRQMLTGHAFLASRINTVLGLMPESIPLQNYEFIEVKMKLYIFMFLYYLCQAYIGILEYLRTERN